MMIRFAYPLRLRPIILAKDCHNEIVSDKRFLKSKLFKLTVVFSLCQFDCYTNVNSERLQR